jgi:hypothetical protein
MQADSKPALSDEGDSKYQCCAWHDYQPVKWGMTEFPCVPGQTEWYLRISPNRLFEDGDVQAFSHGKQAM